MAMAFALRLVTASKSRSPARRETLRYNYSYPDFDVTPPEVSTSFDLSGITSYDESCASKPGDRCPGFI
jgi:hypothetical protein